MAAKYEHLLHICSLVTYLCDIYVWTLLQDIEQAWSLADMFSDRRVGPLKLSTTIC